MRVTAVTVQRREERESAIVELRKVLQPGDTVYTFLRHVSRSGMMRIIGVRAIVDGQPRWISRLVAKATGLTFNEKHEEVSIGGCGVDMGFEVAYQLSRALYHDSFGCIGKDCPSNDHSNGDRDYTIHGSVDRVHTGKGGAVKREHIHSDGGYALKHRWI